MPFGRWGPGAFWPASGRAGYAAVGAGTALTAGGGITGGFARCGVIGIGAAGLNVGFAGIVEENGAVGLGGATLAAGAVGIGVLGAGAIAGLVFGGSAGSGRLAVKRWAVTGGALRAR